jgi:hypothetical protein
MDSDTARVIRDLQQRIARLEAKPGPLYQVDSFVPTWVGAGTAGTFTYTANACLVEWTILGNRLLYNGRIVISAISVAPTGALNIAGWPFAGVSDANMAIAGGGAMLSWAINVAAGYTDVNLNFTNGSSLAALVRSGDNVAVAGVQGGELITGDCRFAGQYRIA